MKEEKLGWRDERISQRHRLWGDDLPAVDLDLVLVEYDRGRAKALIDYKYRDYRPEHDHPSLQALGRLATNSQIPAWITEYDPSPWSFKLRPLNDIAWDEMEARGKRVFKTMSEEEYVEFLYEQRGSTVPKEVLERLRRS